MMDKLSKHMGGARPEYVIVFLLIAILGLINYVGGGQRFFLNFYFLPVVVAGYLLGIRGGVMASVASISIVVLFYQVFNRDLIPSESAAARDWWADLALWGGFLILSGGAVGKLYERADLALKDLHQAYSGVLEILVKFIDTADRYTEAHSVRVSILSTEVARELSLPEQDIEDIRVAALLHDVGKLDVSIDVIRKAGKLDDDEWEQLKKHPEHGANIVETMGGMLSNAVPIILFHHEQFNGNGYYGRKGDQIPLGARIIAVADAFDAMTTDRPYQKARQTWEALEIIEKGSGEHFDPQIVAAFASVMKRRPAGVQRVEGENTKLI
ncbi:MAG TPA: HD-GYP domain-containing protein [Acidobacteriota bacterium]|jgi:putative nucleotidyltransferase with HDIG domain